jgi:uncharacterized lipoprotein YmbA
MTPVRLPRPPLGRARAAARLAACAALLALAACASSPPSHFYTLDGGNAPSAERSAANVPLLVEVPPVNVPAQVARYQFVVQDSPTQVRVLEQQRWVAQPDAEIRHALSADLTRQLDTIDVYGTAYPKDKPVYRVSVNVQRFESWPGSHALIDAVWSVRALRTQAVMTCRSVVNEPVQAGYDALVDGHRRAVQQIATQIAAAIRALAAAPAAQAGTDAAPLSCPAPSAAQAEGAAPATHG